ncbi:MAG: prephenate dehydrogenase/arogenate dehydrogenase family protein [Oligoflexales bacterium]
MSELSLGELRDKIAQVDNQILSLVQQRLNYAVEVGELKRKMNLPVKDYKVEKAVWERNLKTASELGMYQELSKELSHLLVKYAVHIQDENRNRSNLSATESGKKTLIVGGGGQMGQWFCQYFNSFGHTVKIWDPYANPTLDLVNRANESKDLLGECLEQDLIILATPIAQTGEIINIIKNSRTSAIVFDVCSLKEPLIEEIYLAREQGIKIGSIHPMFGPDAQMLAGRNLVLCTLEEEDAVFNGILELFQDTTAQILRIPIEKHDELMAVVLGSSHFVNLLFGQFLSQCGISLYELNKFASTTFRTQLAVSEPVIHENQNLYFDIQTLNKYSREMLTKMRGEFEKLAHSIEDDKKAVFLDLMNQSREFLDR